MSGRLGLSLVLQVGAGVGTERGSYTMQSMVHTFSKQCDVAGRGVPKEERMNEASTPELVYPASQ